MSGTWDGAMRCRGCSADVRVSLEAGEHPGGLAVFYCPACGERCQVEHPAGFDPLSVTASVREG